MSEVIDQFKLDVPSAELKEHLVKRLNDHKVALEKITGSRVQLVGEKGRTPELIKAHRYQIRLLTYVTEHIPENVLYRLSMNDLGGLYVLDSLEEKD